MWVVYKEFGDVVFKDQGVECLCEGFSVLLLEYSGKFFVLIGGEEVRWLVRGGTRW